MSESTLENLLREERRFAPPAALAAQANVTAEAYDEAAADRLGVLGDAGRPPELGEAVGPGARLVQPAVRQVVRRRRAQRRLQLPRPAHRGRPRRQGGDPLGGRARRHPHDHLRRPAPVGLPGGQRADRSRRRRRRPGRDLHADDPGGRGRDAGLRPHRRHPQRRLRRLLGRLAVRPHRGRQREARDHRRRRLPARRTVRRSSRSSTRRCCAARASSTCSWSAAPARTSTGPTGATSGGTRPSRRRAPSTRRSRSTPSTRCSSSTPAARPRSRRASCTPPAAT